MVKAIYNQFFSSSNIFDIPFINPLEWNESNRFLDVVHLQSPPPLLSISFTSVQYCYIYNLSPFTNIKRKIDLPSIYSDQKLFFFFYRLVIHIGVTNIYTSIYLSTRSFASNYYQQIENMKIPVKWYCDAYFSKDFDFFVGIWFIGVQKFN